MCESKPNVHAVRVELFLSFRKKRSILMLGKEVVFFCKPSVLVVRDLQKEYD